MEMFHRFVFISSCIINFNIAIGAGQLLSTTEELSQHIRPEDLLEFHKTIKDDSSVNTPRPPVPEVVDCFGLGSMMEKLPFIFNMKPDNSDIVKTHFYLTSRKQPKRVQVWPGDQFGLEWVDFNPKRMTVMIVHGFMSHSNASWVTDMADAFLKWGDVNVVAVDWSGGGNTWKYWRAVANTRRVGSDITRFFEQLINATGANIKDFYFIGHSLGAHICSFASYHLGLVARITGLDPAQPCFETADPREVLDDSDADYVDVIHTNGRLLHKIGFGHPAPIGHADFYPNGGMKQPGCRMKTQKFLEHFLHIKTSQLNQAVCSHGRSYILFTESLLNSKCYFTGHHWNLTYEGVNTSLGSSCDIKRASCALMGIDAVGGGKMPRARGPYFVLTKEEEPFCPSENENRFPRSDLLRDLKEGFQLDIKNKLNKTLQLLQYDLFQTRPTNLDSDESTTKRISLGRRWMNNVLPQSRGVYQAKSTTVDGGDTSTKRINKLNKILSGSYARQARSTPLDDSNATTDRINTRYRWISKILPRSHDKYYAGSTTINDGDTIINRIKDNSDIETTTNMVNETLSRSHGRQARSTSLDDGDTATDKINTRYRWINKILAKPRDEYEHSSTTRYNGDITTNNVNEILSRFQHVNQATNTALDDDETTTKKGWMSWIGVLG